MSVREREEEGISECSVHSSLSSWRCDHVGHHVFELTMLVQALANVRYLGLNCKVFMGPECFPSSTATFIPLSVLQTWTLPSSEPTQRDTVCHSRKRDLTGRRHTNIKKVHKLTNHDELWVRSEACLQRYAFTVVVALQVSKVRKLLINCTNIKLGRFVAMWLNYVLQKKCAAQIHWKH